jgi:hypothetical protein
VTEGASEHRRGGGGLSTRTAPWLAWAVCALSLALTALTFLLIALDLILNAPIYFYWFESTIIAVGYPVIGAIIASRLPAHPIGWICCAIGVLAAVQHFSGEYAIYALRAPHPEALPGGYAMLWVSLWAWILVFGLIEFPVSVPHWSAAEQALATSCMAQCRSHSNGSDLDFYLTRCRSRRPWLF